MNKAALLIICCMAILEGASGNVSSPRFNAELEEYEVYSAILRGMHKAPAGKSILIVDHTRAPQVFDRIFGDERLFGEFHRGEPFPATTTIINYIRANAHPIHLNDALDTEPKHAMLSNELFDDIFKDGCGGWCAFYDRYPEAAAYVTFSRVGFNGNGTQALVYVVRMCGGLCGGGGYVFLEKKAGAWKTQRRLAFWVS